MRYAKRDSGFGEKLFEVPFQFYTDLPSSKRNNANDEKIFIKGFTDLRLEEIFPPKNTSPKKLDKGHNRILQETRSEFQFYLGFESERKDIPTPYLQLEKQVTEIDDRPIASTASIRISRSLQLLKEVRNKLNSLNGTKINLKNSIHIGQTMTDILHSN
ncbi:9002_t:CDS:1 [Funneliformis geosporum]|uniref:12754_t:CDS:1 n=1 Tax=Funneliformis geosporum TaxID=1117311 RepID=A0A9W4WWT7_9GLOM|nr:12754_t:CDS:1 [Funneliformis geosporum]CAI2180081.1 9002_t:CDS:1 [Funneliformis geosporum]